jgi:UDP-N-acetylmuramyl tripeptide synthase
MKCVISLLFSIFLTCSFTQDTIKYGKDIVIYKDGKIQQKEFNSSKNYIKVVYQYNQYGVLVRRWWYNKEGELISVSLDRDVSQWKSAIEYFDLIWQGHLLDTDGKISAKYRVNSIPHVYVINGKGEVINNGVDLRGEKLTEEIRSQLE